MKLMPTGSSTLASGSGIPRPTASSARVASVTKKP